MYPKHKIKVVHFAEGDDTEHTEVEKILKHRQIFKSVVFFFEWNDHPQS